MNDCVSKVPYNFAPLELKSWLCHCAPYGFVLPHPYPAPAWRKYFLTHPRPLGPREALPYPVKLYFLLFALQLVHFFNETYFINKNILEITTKFIPSNQINF